MAYQNTYYLLLDATLADIGHVLRKVDGSALRRLREMIHTAPRVVVAGEGHVGLIMQSFALHLVHLEQHAAASDNTPGFVLSEDDLLVMASMRGDEAALVQQAVRARDINARVALITGTARSLLMQYADHAVVLDLPPRTAPELFAQVLFVLLEIQSMQLTEDLGT